MKRFPFKAVIETTATDTVSFAVEAETLEEAQNYAEIWLENYPEGDKNIPYLYVENRLVVDPITLAVEPMLPLPELMVDNDDE